MSRVNNLNIPVHFNRNERDKNDVVFTLVSPVYIRLISHGHGLISGAVVSAKPLKKEKNTKLRVKTARLNSDDISD